MLQLYFCFSLKPPWYPTNSYDISFITNYALENRNAAKNGIKERKKWLKIAILPLLFLPRLIDPKIHCPGTSFSLGFHVNCTVCIPNARVLTTWLWWLSLPFLLVLKILHQYNLYWILGLSLHCVWWLSFPILLVLKILNQCLLCSTLLDFFMIIVISFWHTIV